MWERKAAEARREREVWEIVNRERKGRRGINEEIEIREWKKYFMGLLGGVEGRVIRGLGRERGRGEKEGRRG